MSALVVPVTRRHRVGGVHLDQGLVDRGVDDVEDRLGYTPSTTTSAINGPTAHSSRAFRSGMFLTSSRTGPVIVRWYIHRM